MSTPVAPARVRPSITVLTAVVVTVTAWASAFVAIRAVHAHFGAGPLALGRLATGTVALTAALLITRGWVRPTAREWSLVAGVGVIWFGLYNVALNAAEQRLDAGTSAMLVNVGPILIAVLAGVFLGEGFPRRLLIGAGVAFCGVLLIGFAGRGGSAADPLGVALCLLAAAAWAVGVTLQKPALRRLPALQVTQMACTVGMLTTLPFTGGLLHDLRTAPPASIAGVVYLGLIPTALAFGTWAYALTRMTAGRLGVTTYLVPPLTILLAWPLLAETPHLLALAGGAVALTGVALSRRR
ncbi:membrane protein [Actinoplanes sp. SE50]|uniref:DMT family transporter n=1 Tax=unclassified Actinoplanes TaxID=2626549 RepID=UPI00023EBF9A|nr:MULTISPECIES: DMT family transporter [unclassified Actinoplanes]AEV86920.1 putative amino-acid metabolite efflux pump [Actinoplanes sp. SE50/110]ATO85316.1 membrane protein [Actinoplanes sp. SE50]SLM02727.1 membrane protein [Actinoplanes sp. SE50/110]